ITQQVIQSEFNADSAGKCKPTNATIPVGKLPYLLGLNTQTNKIYVPNNGDGAISVIDGGTNTVTNTITVGGSPFGVAVNPVTNTIYVANYDHATVVIDGATNTVTNSITVGTYPLGVAIN